MIEFKKKVNNLSDLFLQMFGHLCKNVTFIVTHDCQLSCDYCYEHHKDGKSMSLETGKKIVDFLFDEDALDNPYINQHVSHGLVLEFIGGEPLLEIDLIDQIMDYFLYKALSINHRWAAKFMILIPSNGINYFNPKVINFLNKWHGRVDIGITIDGDKNLHDMCRKFPDGSPSYDLAAKAFQDAKTRFNQSGTKITISKENLPFLSSACIDMIQKFNLEYLYGNPVFEAVWNDDDANLYYSELKKIANWMINNHKWETTWLSFFSDFIGQSIPNDNNQVFCGGSGKMLAFDVDGTIYPCLRYAPISVGNDLANKFVIGHVASGIGDTQQTDAFMKELNTITRRSMSTDECWNCPIASGCATCTAWQFEHFGNGNRRCTYICPMHKARVMATSYFYNTIYRKHNQPDRFSLNIPKDWAVPIVGEEEYQMLLSLAQPDICAERD